MDPLTRCARIPVDLTMSGGSEAMKMFHVSVCVVLRRAAPPQRSALPRTEDRICGPTGGRESWVPMTPIYW